MCSRLRNCQKLLFEAEKVVAFCCFFFLSAVPLSKTCYFIACRGKERIKFSAMAAYLSNISKIARTPALTSNLNRYGEFCTISEMKGERAIERRKKRRRK